MPNKSLKKNISSKKNKSNFNKESLELLQNGMSQIYILLASSIIVVLYTSSMIYYLNTLKDCKCYKVINKDNSSNLTYLITIESIILAINLFIFLMCIYTISMIGTIKSGGGDGDMIPFYISIVIMLVINGYFIYYVYKLSQNIDPECPCTQSPLRYLLYIQSLITLIYTIIILFNLFV
jgi:hypothetical protein